MSVILNKLYEMSHFFRSVVKPHTNRTALQESGKVTALLVSVFLRTFIHILQVFTIWFILPKPGKEISHKIGADKSMSMTRVIF